MAGQFSQDNFKIPNFHIYRKGVPNLQSMHTKGVGKAKMSEQRSII